MADSPFYRFFRYVDFELPWRTWERLPRPSTHKSEYWDGKCHLSPRPHTFDCVLQLDQELTRVEPFLRPEFHIDRIQAGDWNLLPKCFLQSFGHLQPLASWNGFAALRASRCIVNACRNGLDGRVVDEASFVARDDEGICGAALVTLVTAERLRPLDENDVTTPVVPHLNWLFVPLYRQRHGIGTALLRRGIGQLRKLGYTQLTSTFLMGHDASVLWHWRNGFRLRSASSEVSPCSK